MKKININGEVIRLDSNALLPLSDEELEGASGGQRVHAAYKWICEECGQTGSCCISLADTYNELYQHQKETGHVNFHVERFVD